MRWILLVLLMITRVGLALDSHEQLNAYLAKLGSGQIKARPAEVAEVLADAIRKRIHFGKTLVNGVELTNPLQRTMVMYLSGCPAVKAWLALGEAGSDVAMKYIDDADEELAVTALFIVGRSGLCSNLEKLKRVLTHDKRWVVRNRAVLALYELGRVDLVKSALDDAHWNVRALAVRAIGRTGDVKGLLEAIEKEMARQAEHPDTEYVWGDGPRYWVLRAAGNELKMNGQVQRLREVITTSSSARQRLRAVHALSWVEQSHEAWAGLLQARKDPDPRVRAAAAYGIGMQRWAHRDLRDVVPLLDDGSDLVRRAASEALLEHWNPLMIEQLMPLVERGNADAARVVLALRERLSEPPKLTGAEAIKQAKAFWSKYEKPIKTHDLSNLDFLAPPDACDLDILTVALFPEYSWSAKKTRPAIGEVVTWRATVENRGTRPTGRFKWRVKLDGKLVHEAEHESLQPGEQARLDWRTKFRFANRWIAFEVEPIDGREEVSDYNNRLAVRENSIAAGFWIEDARRKRYEKIQAYFHAGANSYEDWQQRLLAFWNSTIRRSVYLLTPEGALESIRAQKIVRVPDGTLPIAGGLPSNNPDKSDHTVDVMWGFPGKDIANPTFSRCAWDAFPWLEQSLHHEMSHARYLVDLYGVDIRGEDVEVRDWTGRRMFAPSQEPLYSTDQGILMKSGYYGGYSEEHAAAIARIVSRRAVNGAWNAPGNIGEYLNDLPAETTFIVTDVNGRPVPGASVEIYRSVGDSRPWNQRTAFYDKQMDGRADLSGATDSSGWVSFKGNLFTDGKVSGYLGNTIILVVVRYKGQRDQRFFDITTFNMAAWRGGWERARITLPVNICLEGPPPPTHLRAARQRDKVGLTWEPARSGGATAFAVYRKIGNHTWQPIATNIRTNHIELSYRPRQTLAVCSVDAAGNSSRRSDAFVLAPPGKASRVAVSLDGERYFMAGNMFILAGNGSYKGQYGHYCRGAKDLAVADDGAMIFAGPEVKRKIDGAQIDFRERVVVLNPDSYLRWISAEGAIKQPVAVAGFGKQVVAVDGAGGQIVLFDAAGKVVRRFGKDKLLQPVDVAVVDEDTIAVADEKAGQVMYFNGNGQLEGVAMKLDRPRALAAGPSGELYVLSDEHLVVLTGEQRQTVELPAGREAVDVAVAPDGVIVLACKDTDGLVELAPVHHWRAELLRPRWLVDGTESEILVELSGGTAERPEVPAVSLETTTGKRLALQVFEISETHIRYKAGVQAGPQLLHRVVTGMAGDSGRRGLLKLILATDGGSWQSLHAISLFEPLQRRVQIRRKGNHIDAQLVLLNRSRSPITVAASLGAVTAGVQASFAGNPTITVPAESQRSIKLRASVDTSTGLLAAMIPVQVTADAGSFEQLISVELPVQWLITDPIAGKPGEGFKRAYPPQNDPTRIRPFELDGKTIRWHRVPPAWYDHRGVVFLHEKLEPSENAGVYAFTTLFSDRPQQVLLKFGSDDTLTVWLNGRRILAKDVRRGVKIDEDIVKVRLRKGPNPLLIKVWNGEGGWGFVLRVSDEAGRPVPNLHAIVPSD